MYAFFAVLLGASLSGGLFVLAALLIRSCLKNVLPKRFLVTLWIAVLLGFLLLVKPQSPTSIHNFIFFSPTVVDDLRLGFIIRPGNVSDSPAFGPEERIAGEAASIRSGSREFTWMRAAAGVWLAGMAALVAIFLVNYALVFKRFASAAPVGDNPAVNRWLAGKNKRRIRIHISEKTSTPLAFGLFSCNIILPATIDSSDETLLFNILEHEYVHSRSFHNILKVLVYAVVVLHWFNPLAWVFWFVFAHDIELACDEGVIENIGAGRKSDYARSLVAVAQTSSATTPVLSLFSARNIKERVVDVMAYKRPRAASRLLELMVVAAAFLLFGTAALPTRGYAIGQPGLPAILDSGIDLSLRGQAADLAMAACGGGVLIHSEIEQQGSELCFEIRIVSARVEHVFRVDKTGKKIISHRGKTPNPVYADIESIAMMPVREAEISALASIGGGAVFGYSLEYDAKNRRYLHEVEIGLNGEDYEVELDAVTGEVSKIELDL